MSEWISVEDELPPISLFVNVIANGKLYHAVRYAEDKWGKAKETVHINCNFDDEWDAFTSHLLEPVTHWSPISKIPEKSKVRK